MFSLRHLTKSPVKRVVATRLMSSSAVANVDASALPSVRDVMVTLTFVDPSGARRKVPGLVGKLRSKEKAIASIHALPAKSDRTLHLSRSIPLITGKTLWEVAEMHNIDLGPASTGAPVEAKRSEEWTEPLFGEGPTSGFDHVLLTGNGVETAPPRNHVEERMLNHYWDPDEIFPESRLASVIPITKAMDGMIVYVPDRIVDDIP
jgi:hypothetical protein